MNIEEQNKKFDLMALAIISSLKENEKFEKFNERIKKVTKDRDDVKQIQLAIGKLSENNACYSGPGSESKVLLAEKCVRIKYDDCAHDIADMGCGLSYCADIFIGMLHPKRGHHVEPKYFYILDSVAYDVDDDELLGLSYNDEHVLYFKDVDSLINQIEDDVKSFSTIVVETYKGHKINKCTSFDTKIANLFDADTLKDYNLNV